MKILTLIMHTDDQQALTNLLRSLEEVPGFTFSQVEGHGVEAEDDPFLSAKDKVVGYMPRIRVDMLLEDQNVDVVLNDLRNKDNEFLGQGAYWITSVDSGGHLF